MTATLSNWDGTVDLGIFIAQQAQQLGSFLFEIQDRFIQACTNLSVDDIDGLTLDEIEDLFARVLEVNPIDGFLELEKNSPAGLAVNRLVEQMNASSDEPADLTDIYTPDGGSTSNSDSPAPTV